MTAATERITELRHGPPIYIVSGGTGASGELLARTVLAQFPNVHVPLVLFAKILDPEQVHSVVRQVAGIPGAIILHTMVNRRMRRLLSVEAAKAGVMTFDLAGPLEEHLSLELGLEPLGQPGLYRQVHKSYFDRIEAIEFTVAHDDGQRVEELTKAEIVLIGPSRVGKTPLSMYLSMLGWKVANVPFVPPTPLPDEITTVDPRRLVGLMIEPAVLLAHRKVRQQRAGIPQGAYVDREEVIAELRAVRHYFHRHSIPVVDTTDKPIESSAEEIATLVSMRMGAQSGVATAF